MSQVLNLLLTGASGFIGSHVLEALRAAGHRVIALARPNSNVAHALECQAEVVQGDVRDLSSLRAAIRGCDCVVHTAALATDWAPRDEIFETNVRGTLNVLEACRAEGLRRAIITGSISSYGEEDNLSVKDESCSYNSHYPYWLDRVFPSAMNWYRDSKAQATQQALAFARAHHLDLTVIEPVWVYGEREFGTGFYAYVKAVRAGQRFMPGSTRNRFHVIYAPDLAQAYRLACERALPGVERLLIGSPTAEPMHRIFELFCRAAGLEPPRLLPKWSVYPLGVGLELLHTLARSSRPPPLTRARVNMFYDTIQYSTDKARRLLGFACDHTLEQGIRQTVAWYKRNHYL